MFTRCVECNCTEYIPLPSNLALKINKNSQSTFVENATNICSSKSGESEEEEIAKNIESLEIQEPDEVESEWIQIK